MDRCAVVGRTPGVGLEESTHPAPLGADAPPGPSRRAQPQQSRKESGVLRTKIQKGSRPGAALFLCGALLIVPLLLIQNDSSASASQAGADRAAHHGRPGRASGGAPRSKLASTHASQPTAAMAAVAPVAAGQSATPPAATTVPTVPSGARGPVPTQEVVARVVPTTTTPVTAPPTTTTQPVVVASASVHYGQVTYYAHPAGECASPWLSFGTVVRVTNPANGESVSCVVNDREADTSRSIDLATDSFAQIAPLSQGVIDAQLTW